MEWEEGRKEYVLNETGRVYVGNSKKLRARPWNFGQVSERVHGIKYLANLVSC